MIARAWVTFLLIGINVGVYALGFFGGPRVEAAIDAWGAVYGPRVSAGEYYRLVSAGFIHYGPYHILANMYALIQAGAFVEAIYGSGRMLVIYFVALVAGNLVAYLTTIAGGTQTAGASGAIMGLFGAIAVLALRRPDIRGALLRVALFPIVVTLGYGLMNPYVSNAAHIGGVIGGSLAALLVPPPAQLVDDVVGAE